jgi:hypothetical protein
MTTKALGISVLLVALSAAPAIAQKKVDVRQPAASDASIFVDNLAGKVRVIGWDDQAVRVTGTLGEGTEGLDVTGDRTNLRIEVKLPRNDRDRDIEIGESEIEVKIPRGSRLEVQTVSADIDLTQFDGEAELHTVSGEILLDSAPRGLELSTVSGGIRCTCKETLLGGEFKTVSGDIDVAADFDSRGRFKFSTVSGDIALRMRRSTPADISASSFSGSITNELGPSAQRTSKYLPSMELSFALGGGGARLSLQTVSGRISLKEH